MSYKKGGRDVFYVASAVFNVLFTKTTEDPEDVDTLGVAPDETSQSCFRSFKGQEMVALVSHTTSSTREHLRKQGVDNEMIGAKQNPKRNSSNCLFGQNTSTMDCLMSSDSRENSRMGALSEAITSTAETERWILGADEKKKDAKGSDVSSDDENESPTKANADWLKEVGVSPRQVKGASTARRQLSTQLSEREGISSLLVRGPAVQSLYNALMSSDIVHEKTGPYTKIPPTLIATSPFLYGQLLSLSKSSQIISKAGTKSPEYVLELDGGPILPHCTNMLPKFIRAAQLCRSAEEKVAQMQVQDRHTSQGMSDWTTRATNWNTVSVHEDCVKWTKKE